MIPIRMHLYAKFLAWAALNLVMIAAVVFLFAPHDASGLNLLLTAPARERVATVAREISDDLYQVDPAAWPEVLAKHRDFPGVVFSARSIDHSHPPDFAGSDGAPPGRSPRGPPPHGPPPGLEPPINIYRGFHGRGYNVTIPTGGAHHPGPPHFYLITAHADGFWSLLRFLDIGRELVFGLALLAMSALLWWPFIWGITRSIRRLSQATQLMARGRLETRVHEDRRDELGDLAAAVNSMAERLDLLLSGQRQFIADVAHEVISPVARMQIGLGVLEGRLGERESVALADVREDLEQMAVMLNELLLFSRSGVESARASPSDVELRPLIDKLVASEATGARVDIEVADGIHVHAYPAMLSRALANLIRNARRYGAGSGQPVEISAAADADRVRIFIRDRGPGVPESALARLGEPFFRPDLARTRASGGFGLGLAIVRRCVNACDGHVIFQNRPGGGFEVELAVPGTRHPGARQPL